MPLWLPLACLLVLLAPDSIGPSLTSLRETLFFLSLAAALPAVLAAGLAYWAVANLRRSSPSDRNRHPRVIRRYRGIRTVLVYLGIACFAVATLLGGWGSLVRHDLRLTPWPLLDEMVIILPWLPAIGVGLRTGKIVDGVVRNRLGMPHSDEPNRAPDSATTDFWREYGLSIQAGAYVLAASDIAQSAFPQIGTNPLVATTYLGGVLLLGLVLLPGMIRVSWDVRAIKDDRLRADLELSSRAFGHWPPALYVWKSPNDSANAMAGGVFPPFQMVLLSKTLFECLSVQNRIAVLGHELGHLRYWHAFRYWLVSMAVVSLAVAASAVIETRPAVVRFLESGGMLATLLGQAPASVVLGLPMLLAAFAIFKHRFEQQADVAGCRMASWIEARAPHTSPSTLPVTPEGVRRFRQALEHVARLNGMEESDRPWFASSLGARYAFLDRLEVDPGRSDDFDKATSRMVNATVAVLVLLTILLAAMAAA